METTYQPDLNDKSETVINEDGGKQSKIYGRYDLIDPIAIKKLAGVLEHGANKYGERNWHSIPCIDHINHAIAHLYTYAAKQEGLSGDNNEEDLVHAFCRCMFAIRKQYDDSLGR